MDVPRVKEELFKVKQELQDKHMLGQTAEDGIVEDTPEKRQSRANLKRIISQKAF